MKKLIVLLVLVVAMVAAPVFAEVTAPGTFAGDFTYKIGSDFSTTADSVGNDMDITLSASVGEITTFSVEIEANPFRYLDDSTGADIATPGVMTFKSIEMTQDFSSFIGNDMTLKMTVGNFDFGPTEYNNVHEWDFDGTDSYNAVKFVFGVADLAVTAYLPPVQLANEMAIIAGEAVYTTDMVCVAANYVKDVDGEDGTFGANVKGMFGDATAFAQFADDLDAEMITVLVGASYSVDALTVGADFGASDSDAAAFADTGFVAVGVDYDLSDTMTASAGFYTNIDEMADNYAVDAALCMKVDTVGYKLGVAYAPEGSAMASETYAAAYAVGDFAEEVAVSFQMDVDF